MSLKFKLAFLAIVLGLSACVALAAIKKFVGVAFLALAMCFFLIVIFNCFKGGK